MADQLFLSYWLNGFTLQNMLRHYEKMLHLFPFSRLMMGASVFKVIPIAYSEPALIEQTFTMPEQSGDLVSSAKTFQNEDCSFRLESFWDLWQFDGEWKLAPARVALSCFGPAFEDAEEQLQIEFGIDALFLPQPELPNYARMAQYNIRSLLKLVHDLDDALSVDRRKLWSESGENFAEQLEVALRETSGARE
ncbi:MAG TPA: hypothetical protein VKU01_16835 [Bryobacteraceae bacterium]|nr:hypothetical protein [Bryobacteraceae bacterium]